MPLSAGESKRYALILEDQPLTRQVFGAPAATHNRGALLTASAATMRTNLLAKQQTLKSTLAERHITTTGAIHNLLNAVFVIASPDRVNELRSLPGVAAVIPMHPLHPKMDKAINLINVKQAWANFSSGGGDGSANAGSGIKIGIIDTGIDETHPAFQTANLPPYPSGFPVGDLSHTTKKVIAARSYVSLLALGPDQPDLTRPDDLSARDRMGHGTAIAMIAAGVSTNSYRGMISGVAPAAWLGSYKVFGSPGVNDITFSDVVLQAMDDAFADGMDLAVLSIGIPATWSLDDMGATCGNSGTDPCDPWSAAVENAALGGMTIIVAAGNDGDTGPNTINAPGAAPDAITVGATTNAHVMNWQAQLQSPGSGQFSMRWSDGPQQVASITAPLADAGQACAALPAASLVGSIALIQRGTCSFATKANNAEQSGAAAVLFYREPGQNALFQPTGLGNTGIPSALIGADDGATLKSTLQAHPGVTIKLAQAPVETLPSATETVASFSSRGPNINRSGIKPDLVAPGTSIFTATQTYDPNGQMFEPSSYTIAEGTSFAAAMAAGTAAMVKQKNAGLRASQVKSMLANTATGGIADTDGSAAHVTAVGGGKLNAANAVTSNITIEPAILSFGDASAGVSPATLTITNIGSTSANLQLTSSSASVRVTPTSFTLGAGQNMQVSAGAVGTTTTPGSYDGTITVTGGTVPLSIPFLYFLSDGTPAALISLQGDGFVQNSASPYTLPLTFKVVDRYGFPVANVPMSFKALSADSSISVATSVTDGLGIGEAEVFPGPQLGEKGFTVTAAGMTLEFDGRVRLTPAIAATNGVVNAGSQLLGAGLAAGSYASITGTGLSEVTAQFQTPYLPLSVAGVSVSFDVPSAGISVPAHVQYVSPTFMNIQIPWELAGQSSATMKVSIGGDTTDSSQTVTVPIATYSPAFFEYPDAATGTMIPAARDENNAVVNSANPVQRGHVLSLYVNGLGPVNGTPPPSGEPTPATQPLLETSVAPIVTIGGQSGTVGFSGLVPTTVGLYLINVTVPQGIATGLQIASITIGGVTSKATTVPVK